MPSRRCDDCGKSVPLDNARSCGGCNGTFCTRDFHKHEDKYGVLVGQPCERPKRGA